MTIKQLKKIIEPLPDNKEFLVSSDEELNTLFGNWEISEIEEGKYVIFGLSGSEVE